MGTCITSSMYAGSVDQKSAPKKSENTGGVRPMAKKGTYKNDRSFFVFRFSFLSKPFAHSFPLDSSLIPSSLRSGHRIQEAKEVQWRKQADLDEGFRITISFGSTCLGRSIRSWWVRNNIHWKIFRECTNTFAQILSTEQHSGRYLELRTQWALWNGQRRDSERPKGLSNLLRTEFILVHAWYLTTFLLSPCTSS